MMQRIEAIVLAGGSGSRFGGGKLLAPYRGGSLIDGAVRTALSAPVIRTILVTGYDSDNVAEAASALAAFEHPGKTLDIVHANRYADGMAATLKTGVVALSNDVEGAFVFLGDMPNIPVSVAGDLARCIGTSAAAPIYQGQRGHPVLFARHLFPALLQLSGDKGARALLDGLGADLTLVEVDNNGVLFDVDRWTDLAS